MSKTLDNKLEKILDNKKIIQSIEPLRKTNNPFNLLSIIGMYSDKKSIFEIKYVNECKTTYLHNQTQREVKDFIQNEFKNHIDSRLQIDDSTYFIGTHKILEDYNVRLFDIETGHENKDTHNQEIVKHAIIVFSYDKKENLNEHLSQNSRFKIHTKEAPKITYFNKPSPSIERIYTYF